MKTTKLFLGTAALMALFASCQIEELNEGDGLQTATVNRSMEVSQYLWNGQQTKTVFEPGVGLHMTGNETISVYYSQYLEGQEAITGLQSPVEATLSASGSGIYTFSHNEIEGAAAYNYGFVMPHSPQSSVGNSSSGTLADRASVRLCPVQFPGNNNIDATNDYLIGRAQTGVGKAQSLEVTEFKRLFAPFRLMITDEAGAIGDGEKIHTATISFDKAATGTNTSIIGFAYLAFSNDYDASIVGSLTSVSRSNSVSAVFDGGLEKSAGGYPIWFMVNPITIEAGTTVTVTVSTDTKTITRTVSLPDEMVFSTDKFTELTFNISGSGVLPSNSSLTQSFASMTAASTSLTASDGQNYIWAFNDCRFNYADGPNSGVRLNGGTVDLPAFTGKKIKSLKLFSHKRNSGNSSGATADVTATDNRVDIKSGDVVVASGNFNYFAVSATGGILELAIPEEYAESQLTISSNANGTLISAITILFDDSDLDPDAPKMTSALPADSGYSTLYLGREVVVTGENLAEVTGFNVDGIEVSVTGTPTTGEARFIMPTTITGTSAKSVVLSAITANSTTILGTITVYPFYYTKGLRLGIGSGSGTSEIGQSNSILLLNELKTISTAEFVENNIDKYFLSGSNTVVTAANSVVGSEEEYNSVPPYTYITYTSSTLRINNPTNSSSQLKNFIYQGSRLGETFGTPMVKLRVDNTESSLSSAVKNGTLDNILLYTGSLGSNTSNYAAAPSSTSTWNTGSVIILQYINYEGASGTPANSNVARQGYMLITDNTAVDSAGTINEDRSGYIEFDLYWSNPLN